MKTFNEFITESTEDMLNLHGKKVPIDTKDFKGHAHISFDSIKRGRHKTHSYRVEYTGTGPHGPDTHGTYMTVEHDNGKPLKYSDHPHSSKDLSTLLHKAAPKWINVDDLKPRPDPTK